MNDATNRRGGEAYSVRYGISVRMLHPNGRGHGARNGHVMHACLPMLGYAGAIRSLCGYTPSYEWSDHHSEAITCPKCLRKLAKQEKTERQPAQGGEG